MAHNENNLIPLNQRTKEEQREICSAGGRASGAARRRRKSLKEAADLYLSMPVTDRKRWNKMARKGLEPEDIDNQMAVIVGLTEMAALGDSKAAKVLFDLIGEEPEPDETVQDDGFLDALKGKAADVWQK